MHPAAREAIGLCVAAEALSCMVNHALMDFTPVRIRPGEMEVLFKSSAHRDLFLIRMLDFVHEKGSTTLLGEKMSCLGVLERASNDQALSPGPAAYELATAVREAKAWLEHPIRPEFWLGSIGLNVRLAVTRLQLLKISGNQAKHNLARLTAVSSDVHALLVEHGHDVALEQIPFALDDLREHLGENLFIYYGSWLAELMNNLAWAIHRYLTPVYLRSYRSLDHEMEGLYRFEPPEGIGSRTVQHTWFHNLMNHVRRGPHVQPFRASRYLRERSSLEWEDEVT